MKTQDKNSLPALHWSFPKENKRKAKQSQSEKFTIQCELSKDGDGAIRFKKGKKKLEFFIPKNFFGEDQPSPKKPREVLSLVLGSISG